MTIKYSIRILCFASVIMSCFAILNRSNGFTSNLYSVLANDKENVFFSPISLHAALTLIYEGATGASADILQKVLDLPNAHESAGLYKEFISNIAGKSTSFSTNVYVQEGYALKFNFQNMAKTAFMAEVENTDFTDAKAASEQINSWIQKSTHNNIKEIISPDIIERETRLIVVNALYFKGSWMYPFEELHTKIGRFYNSDTDAVVCHMMHTKKLFRYLENAELNAQILEIPYMEDQMKLIIILPISKSGMKLLEEKLVNVNLVSLSQHMRMAIVALSLPKFKLEISMDLHGPLKELGLENIFSQEAEFSNMVDSDEPLRVSRIIQKTFITINENGTEASAANSALIRNRRSLEAFYYTVEANRPFIFYLIDANSNIFFFGKLMRPYPLKVHDEL